MADCDFAVIGGGLIGCASAHFLARGGARVVLLERGQINEGASGQNAGSLHFQLEHRLIQDIDRHRRQLEAQVALARHAIGMWRGIDAELGENTETGMHGGLMVAETAGDVALLERKCDIEQGQGLEVELLDGDAARGIAPYLAPRIRAALHCPSEGHSNPRLLTPAFARSAERAGARLVTTARLTALSRDGRGWSVEYAVPGSSEPRQRLRCGGVLNAAGIWAGRVAALAGLELPVYPLALTMSATERVGPLIPHLVQHVGRKLSLKQTEDGNLLIGGGWGSRLREVNGEWLDSAAPALNMDSVLGNLEVAADIVPRIASLRLLRTWTGATAMTPDALPMLGEARRAPGFFVAAAGTGFTFGPTYAKLVSELMLNGASSFALHAFAPSRFDDAGAPGA